MTTKAKTNPFTFRITWKPFTQQDIDWVQKFIALLPNNPELSYFKKIASKVHTTDSGEGQYSPLTDEFEYYTDDMLVLGDYTITKTITTDVIETITKTTRRERFNYVVHEPVHSPSPCRWEPDDTDVAELGEAASLADAVKMILLREYEALFDMCAEAMAVEQMMEDQANAQAAKQFTQTDFHAECA